MEHLFGAVAKMARQLIQSGPPHIGMFEINECHRPPLTFPGSRVQDIGGCIDQAATIWLFNDLDDLIALPNGVFPDSEVVRQT